MNTLHKKPFSIFVLLLVLVSSCKYWNDSDLRLARDFIDAYYVAADQKKALELASGRAAELLQKEIGLLQGVDNREMAYKTRDVVFDLTKEDKTESEANFFYNLKIIQPDLADMTKRVHIVIDRKLKKVKDFKTVE
jgi:hypothetical protein